MTHRLFAVLCAMPLVACNLIWAGNPVRTKDIGVGISTDPALSEVRQVAYACDGAGSLTVTFDNPGGRVIIAKAGAAPLTLPQKPAGSGFRYADSASEFSGKGDEALWTTGGKTLRCTAKR